MTHRLGLIVNPVAGLGGRVGLKGSDGTEVQALARRMGAEPLAHARAIEALQRLEPLRDMLTILTYPGEMGERAARECGFTPEVFGAIEAGASTPEDTVAAAVEMRQRAVDLILFAGGDGTARDLVSAVGATVAVLGIPAGVKILSAAFATNPRSAGDLACSYLAAGARRLREAEVLDLDEDAYRSGRVSPRLFGGLRVPDSRTQLQGRKSPSAAGLQAQLQSIAQDVIDQLRDDVATIVGPGTTTRPILTRLGLEKTLVGVDVLLGRALLVADANETDLLAVVRGHPSRIVVTPIGGQGFIFGRGNAPISPAVLRTVGREHVLIVSAAEKLHALRGRPLLVDTGDPEVDRSLCGYARVITGYNERAVYRVAV